MIFLRSCLDLIGGIPYHVIFERNKADFADIAGGLWRKIQRCYSQKFIWGNQRIEFKQLLGKKILPIAILLLASFQSRAQVPAATVPAFSFTAANKTAFTHQQLQKNSLLFFCFFDVSCSHCQHAIEKISSHYKEFSKTAIYLISLDKPEAMNAFLKKHGGNLTSQKNVTILQDTQDQFITLFRPKKYPSLFLYDQHKKLLLYDDEEAHFGQFLRKVKEAAAAL